MIAVRRNRDVGFEDTVAKQTGGDTDPSPTGGDVGASATPAAEAAPVAPEPAAAGQTQQLIVNAQYIKDFSFENPRAPQSLMAQATPPSVDIKIDVNAQSVGPDNYEVTLTINASAKSNEDALFSVELTYAALATVRNVPQEAISQVILVETPRLMFPFARNIVAETTRDGGFPPLMINPIDFTALSRQKAAEQSQAD